MNYKNLHNQLDKKQIQKALESFQEESADHKNTKTINLSGIVILVMGAMLFLFFSIPKHVVRELPPEFFVGAVWVAAMILLTFFVVGRKAMYKRTTKRTGAYKKTVINHIFKQLEPVIGLKYSSKSSFTKEDFNKLDMFGNKLGKFGSVDYFRSEDMITGEVDGFEVMCSEVVVTHEPLISVKKILSRGLLSKETLFAGDIYTIKIKEPIKSNIIVYPSSMLNKGPKEWEQIFSNMKLIKMDNTDFEKAFKVMADDDVGARYFLTPRFMELIVKTSEHLERNGGGKLYLETKGKTLYLMIHGAPNKFEPASWQHGFDPALAIWNDITSIALMFELIESLNLNEHHTQVNRIQS